MFEQGVRIFFLKHILEFLVLRKNLMWMWLNIWWGKNVNEEHISFLGNLYEGSYSNKERLKAPRPFLPFKSSFYLKFLHAFNKGFTL